MSPCSACEGYMKQGVIFIGIDNDKSSKDWNKPDGSKGWMPNPYRTGEFAVVTTEGVKRLFNQENDPMLDFALKHRFMFIEGEAMRELGMIKD